MIFLIGGAWQGKGAYAREHFGAGYTIIDHYHERVRQQLSLGLDVMEEAEALLAREEALVIISDEVGYGLVPVDAFERQFREMSGRVNCFFAERAEQVIRVICGVGSRIK